MKENRLEIEYLHLDKIDIGVSNVRKRQLKKGLGELKASIEDIDLQQPIVVIPKGERYDLVIGQRRYLACQELGWTEIPAIIRRDLGPTEARIASFSENIHRLELDYRDKMEAATGLLDRLGSVAEVARRLGVSIQTVRNYLGYQAVPELIKKMVSERKLGAITATRIARAIPDDAKAIEIARSVVEIPRSDRRRKLVAIARENPDRTPAEILTLVEKSMFTRITVDLTPDLAEGLRRACTDYGGDPKDITLLALEEWLRNEGFI